MDTPLLGYINLLQSLATPITLPAPQGINCPTAGSRSSDNQVLPEADHPRSIIFAPELAIQLDQAFRDGYEQRVRSLGKEDEQVSSLFTVTVADLAQKYGKTPLTSYVEAAVSKRVEETLLASVKKAVEVLDAALAYEGLPGRYADTDTKQKTQQAEEAMLVSDDIRLLEAYRAENGTVQFRVVAIIEMKAASASLPGGTLKELVRVLGEKGTTTLDELSPDLQSLLAKLIYSGRTHEQKLFFLCDGVSFLTGGFVQDDQEPEHFHVVLSADSLLVPSPTPSAPSSGPSTLQATLPTLPVPSAPTPSFPILLLSRFYSFYDVSKVFEDALRLAVSVGPTGSAGTVVRFERSLQNLVSGAASTDATGETDSSGVSASSPMCTGEGNHQSSDGFLAEEGDTQPYLSLIYPNGVTKQLRLLHLPTYTASSPASSPSSSPPQVFPYPSPLPGFVHAYHPLPSVATLSPSSSLPSGLSDHSAAPSSLPSGLSDHSAAPSSASNGSTGEGPIILRYLMHESDLVRVWRGWWNGQDVVLKISKTGYGKVVEREGLMLLSPSLRQLDHLVVPALGLYTEGRRMYLVLEYGGKGLDGLEDDWQEVPVEERLALFSALCALHLEHHLQHNDPYPRNAVSRDGQVRWIDFGLARLEHDCPGSERCGELLAVRERMQLEEALTKEA